MTPDRFRVFVQDGRVFLQMNNREFEVVVPPVLHRYSDTAAEDVAAMLRDALSATRVDTTAWWLGVQGAQP